MVAGAAGLVLLVLRYGEGLSAPAPGLAGRTITGTGAGTEGVALHLLIALAVVVVVGRLRALVVTALTLAFIGVMFAVVRPLAIRLASQGNTEPTLGDFAVTITSLLVASTVTEVIGVHAIFGAFSALTGVSNGHLFGRESDADSAIAQGD